MSALGTFADQPSQAVFGLSRKSELESETSTEYGESLPSTRSSSPAPTSRDISEGAVILSQLSPHKSSPLSCLDEALLPTASDLDALEAMMCRLHKTKQNKPVSVESLQGISLATVCGKLLEGDWAINHLLRGNSRASGFAFSWPVPGRASGGLKDTQVRKNEFRMRLPEDVPKAITALVGVPESTRISQVYSLSFTESEVILVQQTTSHDVMFGDNFRVQQTFSWRYADEDTVEQSTWLEVVWVRPLPWTHGVIKTFIDKSAKKEAKELAASLAWIICQ